MGDHLYSRAEIFAAALLIQDIPVHLSGGQIGVFVQILINKPLVMAEIQVGLGAVFGHIDLAVLVRAHGAGINVDIRVQLLGRDLQSPCLQQPAKGGGCDTFAES